MGRARSVFVAASGGRSAIEFGGEREIRARNVLDLFPEGSHFGGAKFWFLVLKHSWSGSEVPFVFGHGFGRGADVILLKFEGSHDGLGGSFIAAEVGGGRLMLRSAFLGIYGDAFGKCAEENRGYQPVAHRELQG